MTATPSRQFLLQQATLTVFHDRYPASQRIYGRTEWAEKLSTLVREGWHEGGVFCWLVRQEFNSLARKHGVKVAA